MNRIEFMTGLAALLQDIPEIERKEAMQYYNDYFDDAGEENEQEVILELESPDKVAAKIKAGLDDQEDQFGEYSESGYTDTRFEDKETPAGYRYHGTEGTYSAENGKTPPKTSPVLKVILIIAIVIVGAPVAIPVALACVGILLGGIAAVFGVFAALLIASLAVAVAGAVLLVIGIATIVPELAAGLALTGIGLILGVLGTIALVASVKLCILVFPAIFRGIVWICRKPFHRKAVA